MQRVLDDDVSMTYFEQLCTAAEQGNTAEVERLISLCTPQMQGSYPLRAAAAGGHVDCLKILLPVSDPLVYQSNALLKAVEKRHTACIELLAPVSSIEQNHFIESIIANHWDGLSLLIAHSQSKNAEMANISLVFAARHGRPEIVTHLIDQADATHHDSAAIVWAIINGHSECVDLLYSLSDMKQVMAHFANTTYQFQNDSVFENVKQRYEAEQQRTVLQKSLEDIQTSHHRARKI